ncbi:metallophosphoesterase family protein [Enterococcus raffinosus]|uniref:Metallophosphoesterase n=1 Tax=Enterococcus raffinosus TaxID=71452 RepID=A0AAW8T829_9ENTE|nr:metallophosphoesterase [Enterococcus raffinosus]MDT2524195.1 metallophosphoesterase [Enterococcus raffinosus]MDT2531647.1 metallophosphoesterase [Enterococcus raffinosus]MDT2535067.1 metallophosphoesterase [Enterococcus raffinosus]MDT2545088.1 metallophosphoesterase [Enterococcus raffinosus]MDT2554812.1 metallophosphoesterase [Enterococcus raffinosus]
MKSKENEKELMVRKGMPSLPTKTMLPPALAERIERYPENKRRPVNKTVFKNDYFQLTYNTRNHSMAISSKGDLVYSAIPYDTARNYIQRAAIQYLLHPEEIRRYIELHQTTVEKYLTLSIFQVTGKRVDEHSFEVKQAYNAILQNPLLEIQIAGRLMQHDETGPLSANLAGKFLFSENIKTGIAGYISEYLNFVVQVANSLPLMIDGKEVQLLETVEQDQQLIEQTLSIHSDIDSALSLLPSEVKQGIENALVSANATGVINTQPLLRSEYGEELSRLRENYIAHSVHPDEAEKYFQNVHSTENRNLINVVSDIHTKEEKLPFLNRHFNILAGDVSDSHLRDEEISGIYMIGGHELIDVLPETANQTDSHWEKWRPFFNYEWFKELLQDPDEAWYLLPTGEHPFYEVVAAELAERFPKMNVLNNQSVVHEGIRYIGLTIPVALVKRKKAQQHYILNSLEKLLAEDPETPTVIVSHAPLFNELSLLPETSDAYNKDYSCEEPKIEKLFEQYPIIGVIHGHHHIPASSRRFKKTEFAGKQLFVVCSIYSKVNTGFELMSLL